MHPKEEKTFVIIKPDGIQRSLVGEIISRLERVGLKLVAMKLQVPSAEHVEAHYSLDPEWKKNVGTNTIKGYDKKGIEPPSRDPLVIGDFVLDALKKYLTAGPIISMVWQGAHSVKLVRKLVGVAEPLSSDVGTIRGDYVLDSYQMADNDKRAVRNLIHASGSVEEADMEIEHWFTPEEMIGYKLAQEQILYDVNFDGLME